MAAEPQQGVSFTFYSPLGDKLDPDTFLIDPTIVAGDFRVSIDGAALANMTNLPSVSPSGSSQVEFILTDAEMTGSNNVSVVGIDVADDEWQNITINVPLPTGNSESVFDVMDGDRVENATSLVINKKDTTTPLINKIITGSLYSGTQITTKEP